MIEPLSQQPVALVTGAGRGIGRGIATALAGRGWAVAINYRSNAAAAAESLQMVEAAGGRGLLCPADIGDSEQRERMLAAVRMAFGRLDLLVNNAGMAPRVRTDLLEMTPASYAEVLATNLHGPFFLTQAVARWMIAEVEAGLEPRPKIINIGSISAYTSSLMRGEYCIAKAGMAMMTTLFADRLAEYGINVYELRPGIIATDMTAPVQDRYRKLIAEGLLPIRRMGEPEDVGRAVLALADGALAYSTGEIINIDGGFHMRRL
jgi:NAD(P)-dependent dehydrogenase (short-subunit alcohol dehydrogenase family)